jgi:hypothetical protein
VNRNVQKNTGVQEVKVDTKILSTKALYVNTEVLSTGAYIIEEEKW